MKSTTTLALMLLMVLQSFGQMPITQDSLALSQLQLTSKDSIINNGWIVGLGLNVVDDSGDEINAVFDVRNAWNILPFPSRISVGKYFDFGLGIEFIGTVNRYKEGVIVDGAPVTEDIPYYGADIRLNYDLNEILGDMGWFDPYVGLGMGYTDANNQGRGTFNTNLGFRTWLSDKWGLDFSTVGKWTLNSSNSTNHIQHAAGVVRRFAYTKKLNKKGEEKLAQLRALEEELQRKTDSLTQASMAEAAAAKLAAELEERKEAERLLALEKAKEAALNARKDSLNQTLYAIGKVYFKYNTAQLSSEAKDTLARIAQLLQENTDLNVTITSHTDARGSSSYNEVLSSKRMLSTKNYLIGLGIDAMRIDGKGMGESDLANNCTDGVSCNDGLHQQNRRSEFSLRFN